MEGKKVAIVGSGAAGIAAAWALTNYSLHDVYLYEANERLGGHSNTVQFEVPGGHVPVDTGFIVLNSATYPNFISFLKATNTPTMTSEMSFSVSRDGGVFEWAGSSLSTVFAQARNLISPAMWRMLFDIVRFNYFALDLLRTDIARKKAPLTIGEYLKREGYSKSFQDNYLLPMTAAIWSTSPEKCALQFPAMTLVRFLWNHHLLNTISSRPAWLTLKNGAKSYIDAVMSRFPPQNVYLSTPVKSVANDSSGRVILTTEDGVTTAYDHVILATHGPQAMSIISCSATPAEKNILSAFETSPNTAVLHSDVGLMPRDPNVWSSWNYLTTGDSSQVSLTYCMNKLQGLPYSMYGPVLVTLNPLRKPDPNTIHGTYTYAHPLYTPTAIEAQDRLQSIQGTRGISYAGAWTKYGFHEDAFTSGLNVAVDQLGAKLPFSVVDSKFRRGTMPQLTWKDDVVRFVLQAVQVLLSIFDFLFS